MAQETKQKNDLKNSKVETKQEDNNKAVEQVVVQNYSIANTFKTECLNKHFESRKKMGEHIVNYLKSKGKTINNKGKPILLEKVTAQIGHMIKDMTNYNKTNKARPGWWSLFEVIENEKGLTIVTKTIKKDEAVKK